MTEDVQTDTDFSSQGISANEVSPDLVTSPETFVPWGPKDVLVAAPLAVVAAFFGLEALPVILSFAGISRFEQAEHYNLVNVAQYFIIYGALVFVPVAYFKKRGYRVTLNKLGFRRTPVVRTIIWTIPVLFLILTVIQVWGDLMALVPGYYEEAFGSFFLAFFAGAILVPVAEEVFFRGIIFQGLNRRFGAVIGTVLSAVVFTSFHLSIYVSGEVFISGILLALLFFKTRSLWPSIFCHSVANTIGIILAFAISRPQ